MAQLNNDNADLSVPQVDNKIIYIEGEVYSRVNNGLLTKEITVELHSNLEGTKKIIGYATVEIKDVINSLETYHTLKLVNNS